MAFPLASLVLFSLTVLPLRAELVINEVLFNPPGSDSPAEYIELRGTPNLVLPDGTFLLSIEGDMNGNPGVIQNRFDLSERRVGQNGFLVLLQKFHDYEPDGTANVRTNSDSGAGWGSGSSSSVDHRGEEDKTELEDASCTFFLVQTTNSPAIGDDIDIDDNGQPDGVVYGGWEILDSVGILDNSGLGDFAYGAINFRRDSPEGSLAFAGGVIVPVSTTPQYVGRVGNSSGWAVDAWVASDELADASPVWRLGENIGTTTNTWPNSLAGALLDHIGAPNFGAPVVPSILVTETDGVTEVAESGATDTFLMTPSVAPAGPVSVEIKGGPQLEVSTDGGSTFGSLRVVTFSSTAGWSVHVRAIDDQTVDFSPRFTTVTSVIVSTADAERYPTASLLPEVEVGILDNDSVVLSEVYVNPPGPDDAPDEFIELRGLPSLRLTNVYLVALEGDVDRDPGVATLVVDLTGHRLGGNGVLVVAAPGAPYTASPLSSVVVAPQLGTNDTGLGNDGLSLLLIASPKSIREGRDLDDGDNGIAEELPKAAIVLDAVGWRKDGSNDVLYGGVDLTQPSFTPDAAVRFPGNDNALAPEAWFVGDLKESAGVSLEFDSTQVSQNFPEGTLLTPGEVNNTAPAIESLAPLSHVIGDPENPAVLVRVQDLETTSSSLVVTASSSNQEVVSDGNLALIPSGGGEWNLRLEPTGVGYSDITVTVSDGGMTGRRVMSYAASAMGRSAGRWHTGISDGSAAFAVDDDWMFIGDDENQVLRLYSRKASGGAVVGYDMNPFLQLIDVRADGTPREVDIEAATSVGDRILWLGSHSHGLNAAAKTNRARFFSTAISGSGTNGVLTYVGRYDFLKVDLIAWDAGNGHGKGSNYYGLEASSLVGVDAKEPDGSGFNIEGLEMAPGSSEIAYVGFRAPLVPPSDRVHALIVPVNNFVSLATVGGGPSSAQFGDPIELNLGCRGIRSLHERDGSYLIVAGPPGNGTNFGTADSRLFTWDGDPASAPEARAASLEGLNVEGIVTLPPQPWGASTEVQLISDNGTAKYYDDDVFAKFLTVQEFKKFRSDWVALGEVVPVQPTIRHLSLSPGSLTLTWCSVVGLTYRVQCTVDLTVPDWVDLSGDVVATGPLTDYTVPVGPDEARFCRVLVVTDL